MKECVRRAYGYSGQDNYKDLLDKVVDNKKPKGVVSKMLSYVGLDDGMDKIISKIGRSRRLQDGTRRRVDGNYFRKRSHKKNDGIRRRSAKPNNNKDGRNELARSRRNRL